MKLTIYIALAVLLFSSCKPSKDLVFQDLQNFSMKPGSPPAANVNVRMYNPNRYKLTLKNADVSVFINNNELGKMHVDGKHVAPALDTFLMPVTISIDPKYSMISILQWAMAGDISIKVTGNIRGGRRGIYIKVPVNYEGIQNLKSSLMP